MMLICIKIILILQQIWIGVSQAPAAGGGRADEERGHPGRDGQRHDQLLRRDQQENQHGLFQVYHEAGELRE